MIFDLRDAWFPIASEVLNREQIKFFSDAVFVTLTVFYCAIFSMRNASHGVCDCARSFQLAIDRNMIALPLRPAAVANVMTF